MGKKKDRKRAKRPVTPAKDDDIAAAGDEPVLAVSGGTAAEAPAEPRPRMKRREFEKELETLQVELVKLQEWVKASGAKVCVLFEGRDAAGKGGVIKRITERTSPRVFRLVALPSPTDREKSQMYVQRYITHLPAAGEVVLFDRNWYNRAGVERVMGFTPEAEVEKFLKWVPPVENAIIGSGVILVSTGSRRPWKTRPSASRNASPTIGRSETEPDGPGEPPPLVRLLAGSRRHVRGHGHPRIALVLVDSHDQRRGRLNCIAHLLSLIPYEEVPREKVKLPRRQPKGDYVEPDYPFRRVPERY